MKIDFKHIITVLLAFVLVASFVCGSVQVMADPIENIAPEKDNKELQMTVGNNDGFAKVIENDKFELYYKETTAETALKEKASGYVWYSNPQDRDSVEDVGSQTYANVSSQIMASYYESVDIVNVDSYTQSTSIGQTKYNISDDILTVEYNFGVEEYSKEMLPTVVSKEDFEKEILSKLTDDEKDYLLKYYSLFERSNMDEDEYDLYSVQFPALKKYDIYALFYCPTYLVKDVYELLVDKCGYNFDMLTRYCKANDVENNYKPPVTFKFVIEYKLNDDGLNVQLDTEKTEYDKNYPPIQVDLLPYFGSASAKESGYMFVPDGSGAIINFNNKKVEADKYWKILFGKDNAITELVKDDNSYTSVLPVFAIANANGHSFYASIDEGYECAGITADVAGGSCQYNYVNSFYQLIPYSKISMRGKETADDTSIKYPEKVFSGKVDVSYHIMDKYASYSEIACAYRDYLSKNGILEGNADDDSYINAEFYATARIKKNFLGFTYTKLMALTEFNAASEILSKLGAENVDTVYTYALSSGKTQGRVIDIDLASCLGDGKDLKNFMDKSDTGYISFAARVGSADTPKRQSSYTLSRELAKIYTYEFISKYYNRTSYSILLKPDLLKSQAETVSKSAKKQGIDAVNITDLGYRLDSDFNRKNGVDRHGVRLIQEEYLKKLSENCKVSVDYGSIFSAKYVSKIWNIPVTSSKFAIEDVSIPFYEIVIRGTTAYVAPSINQSADSRTAFLNAVEAGAEIRYSWIATVADKTLLTDFTENYFDCFCDSSIDEAKQFAAEAKELFDKIGQAKIVSHRSVSSDLKEIKYENGYTVYVNYAENAVDVAGQTIDAEDFICVKTAG